MYRKNEFAYNGKDVTLMCHRDYVGNMIDGCFYEIKMLQYISSLRLGGTYIDAGANIGNHTVFFGMFCNAVRVVSFEPVAENIELLEKNVEGNGLSGKTVICKHGVGAMHYFAEAQTFPHNMGMCKITSSTNGEIEVIQIDEYVAENPGMPGVTMIKIDVEGMDLEVLKGAEKTISKYRPHLFVEAATKEELDALDAHLSSRGYKQLGVFNATPTYYYKP